jgi:ribosomal protein S18 acetylase RimI-like enzyme
MDENFQLIQAQPGDLDALNAMFRRTIRHMRDNGLDQWDDVYPDRSQLAEDISRGEMYLLRKAGASSAPYAPGEIVAAVVLNEDQWDGYETMTWSHDGKIAVVHRLCVDPTHQKRGIAKLTFQLGENLLKSRGYDAIRLDTFSQNTRAVAFYERAGYTRVGELNWRKGLFYLYEKPLRNIEVQP